jgi:hypothetical protein
MRGTSGNPLGVKDLALGLRETHVPSVGRCEGLERGKDEVSQLASLIANIGSLEYPHMATINNQTRASIPNISYLRN